MGFRYGLGLVVLASIATGFAHADELDSMLAPGDKLRTRLVAGEGKTVAIGALAGTKLTVTVKRAKRSSVEPRLEIADPDGVVVDLGKRLKASKKQARAKGVVVDRTGTWRAGFFALSGGGDVDVSVAAGIPKKMKAKGTLESDTAVHEETFSALPGTELRLSIKAKGKTPWTPIVEIIDPDGGVLVPPTAAKNKPLPMFADLLGDYTLRVSGGPGSFTAKMSIKAPRVKGRLLDYKAVEALPRIDDFTPPNPHNDDIVRIDLVGVGFSTRQSVTLSTPERGFASAKIKGSTADGAYTELDLTGVPPGEYLVGIATSAGNATYAEKRLILTNRPPGVILYSAPEFPAYPALPVTITGRGFDPDCLVGFSRSTDGTPAPVYVVGQEGHTILDVVVTPQAYKTGPYDVTIWDPNGEYRTFPEAVEVVGHSKEPKDVYSRFEPFASDELYPRDTTYAADDDRVLISMIDGLGATFLLLNARTQSVVDSWTAPSTNNRGIINPRVSWDPVNDTFAMSWVQRGSSTEAFVRICDADDLDSEISLTEVSDRNYVSQVDVAANEDDGGYVAVWHESRVGEGSEILSRAFAGDGTPDDDTTVAFSNNRGLAWSPTVVYRGDGEFVAAHVGANNVETVYAVRRIVLNADATVEQGSLAVANSVKFFDLYQPELAVDPNTGNVLLGFTYRIFNLLRPAFVMLKGAGASPGDVQSEDGDGLLAWGVLDGVAWNPQRDEFVTTLSVGSGIIVVRRVESDSRIRPAYFLEQYEGVWGIPWSGPEPGELGLVRAYDGDEDGYHTYQNDEGHVRAGPLY